MQVKLHQQFHNKANFLMNERKEHFLECQKSKELKKSELKNMSMECKGFFNFILKRQSHEKVYKFLTWDGSFSLN
jgi:thiaminase